MTGIVFSIGDTTIGGRFAGTCSAEFGILMVSGQVEFYLEDAFADPADIGVEGFDLGETIYENIHRPLNDYLRGRRNGRLRLGIHTGEPYSITDQWGARFRGRFYADAALSEFR
ncbi:hypothetical protein [Actibacterium sp.]|uniref:hypothetical protein n=1 Tax=Actibacterium sp. TaxID=1872125 RepID=UPI00356AAAA1